MKLPSLGRRGRAFAGIHLLTLALAFTFTLLPQRGEGREPIPAAVCRDLFAPLFVARQRAREASQHPAWVPVNAHEKLAYLEKLALQERFDLSTLKASTIQKRNAQMKKLEKIVRGLDFTKGLSPTKVREAVTQIYRVLNQVPNGSWGGMRLTPQEIDHIIEDRIALSLAQKNAVAALRERGLLIDDSHAEKFANTLARFRPWLTTGMFAWPLVNGSPPAILPQVNLFRQDQPYTPRAAAFDHYWEKIQKAYATTVMIFYLTTYAPPLLKNVEQAIRGAEPSQAAGIEKVSDKLAEFDDIEVQMQQFKEQYRETYKREADPKTLKAMRRYLERIVESGLPRSQKP